MKKYYEEISNLRGIAILLVLLGHSIIFVPINLMDVPWCKTLYTYIYSFNMPLFFIVSGFLYSYKNNYISYIYTKIKRILIPYLVFGIVDLVFRHAFPSVIHGNSSLKDDAISIILSGGQYWFLYVLFIIFLIYPLLNKLFINKVIIATVMIILVILHFFNISDLFLINYLIKYMFYFIIGILLKSIYSGEIKQIMSKKYMLVSSFIVFILIGLAPNNIIISIIRTLIGCIMAYSVIISIKFDKVNKSLKDFGEYSLQLYLLNGFMLVPARLITVKILHITNPIIVILIIFISNALIGIFISKYIINKINIFKYLCGIKINKEIISKTTILQ